MRIASDTFYKLRILLQKRYLRRSRQERNCQIMDKLLIFLVLFIHSIVADDITPILNVTKCAGLGLENLTPADILNITSAFNYSDPNINLKTVRMSLIS